MDKLQQLKKQETYETWGMCKCGTTKTQFIKSPKGGSLLNNVINNLPVEMHLPGHNFKGPGTKLNKRLNPDLTPKK